LRVSIWTPPLVYISTIQKEEHSLYAFASGLRGESIVAEELRKLDNTFSVFWDMRLPNRRDNLDFVVLGPNSNFLIEVKNHKGEIGYSNNQITCNGKPFEVNFIKRAKSQAWTLSDYIESVTHKRTFINPIIVFSNSYTHTRLGPKPIDGVYIIQRDWLTKTISPYPLPGHETDTDILEALKELKSKKFLKSNN
jgi:hypothetical protein